MNKNDSDISHPIKIPKSSSAIGLINGLEDRQYGHFKKKAKGQENVELYAEEQLVQKPDLNEMRCEMPGLPRSTFLMVFSPDGSRVASTHGNHNIYVTDIRSGKNIKTLVGHPRTPWCIAFHPTSNQIVASGCLGGQVRIWDLSGGSEVWTTSSQSVIASIAFHPNDRVLVIATYNEVYFWDWSRPEPFVHAATSNPKEKVRYVAFDKLGHKLITGIANSPQTRWERVRAPVPVPRQERCVSPYRRRITQRLVNTMSSPQSFPSPVDPFPEREPLSGVPERERRITVCYRNLVREYEQLVHRYLQLYRPPTMIDRGTDPMEPSLLSSSGTQTPEPSTSSQPSTSKQHSSTDTSYPGPSGTESPQAGPSNTRTSPVNEEPQPSTSRFKIMYSQMSTTAQNSRSVDSKPSTSSQSLITPSRIFCVVKKPTTLIRGTQTSESRKHKADQNSLELSKEKRFKNSNNEVGESSGGRLTPNIVNELAESSNSRSTTNVVNEANVAAQSNTSADQSQSAAGQPQSAAEQPQSAGDQPQSEESSGRVLVVSLQRLTPDNLSSSNRPQSQTEGNQRADNVQRNRRDIEEDLLWVSGAPQTSIENRLQLGLDEFIRLNQQRLATIQHRQGRLRSRGAPTYTLPIQPTPFLDINRPEEINEPINVQPSTSAVRVQNRDNLESERMEALPSDPQRTESTSFPSSSSAACSHNPCQKRSQRNVDELLSNIRRTAEEEVRNRILPIIRSVPANDRPELIRLFENSREHVRMRFRQMCPTFLKKPNRRPVVLDSSSDTSSSEDEQGASSTSRLTRRNSEPTSHTTTPPITTVTDSISSNNASSSNPNVSTATTSSVGERIRVRNFNSELEQLVTSLLTEIERNETDRPETNLVTTNVHSTVHSTVVDSSTFMTASTLSSARTRPSCYLPTAPPGPPEQPANSLPNTDALDNLLFQEILQMTNPERRETGNATTSTTAPPTQTTETPVTIVNTNTRTTNSTIYTSNSVPRRRLFSHRVSAFMPTRVNYTRAPRPRRRGHTWSRRPIPRLSNEIPSFALDELINYSERENSEDDPPLPQWNFHPFDPPPEFPSINPENIGIGSMYSNIVQDLESSLNDVRNIRASNRPGETSGMLSSFSERLENIMNQSDTILRNLRSTMEMLPTTTEANISQDTEPSWTFNDQGFYVRDLRSDAPNTEPSTNETLNLSEIFLPFRAVAADHTYPRNPINPTQNDNMSPLMTSLHLTITHIQRQARLLRQQVESIERIDRAMLEVAQLQLIRQLLIELVRHVRTLSGESRSTGMSSVRQMMAGTRISDLSPYELLRHVRTLSGENRNTGMSSVRQMMAGTRISDSSPYDSPSDEPASNPNGNSSLFNPAPSPENAEAHLQPGTSSSNPADTEPNTTSNNSSQSRPRTSNRKTYPPSRLFRLARHCQRRPSVQVHWFSRRHVSRFERGVRQNMQPRSSSNRANQEFPNPLGSQGIFSYSTINSSTLGMMTRRLEHLLTDQMRVFTRPQEAPQTNRSTASIDLREHIHALRLHGCLLRMNRVLGSTMESSTLRNLRSDATAAVTQDGAPRYGARHTLSLIIDGMSRHVEELGSSNIQQSMHMQIHGVLAMSLLLTELLLLQVVDSIPPPTGMNLESERESLTTRIDQMCSQMLQSRFSVNSYHLTRSLRLMRLTMRHAYRALGQTYNARRDAMMPRCDTDRRQLLRSIKHCLRSINRRRPNTNAGQNSSSGEANQAAQENNDNASPSTSGASNDNVTGDLWYSTINDLITRYSDNRDDVNNQPSTSNVGDRGHSRDGLSSNNDNSDAEDNDDEPDWYRNNNTSHNNNLYRTNNVNLVQTNETSNPPRPWNVPSVQVNDVPVSEPSLFHQRIITQRQRFAERLSELRSNPTMGLFRPRFLHPLYASVNPFDGDLDDSQREQIYDSDMITTVTPNHRIQAWDISNWTVPVISNSMKNIVVSECKIHNDASVDIAKDGTILVTLLPSGGYLNVTNKLGVYSLRWETLGQCLYTTSLVQNAVSVSLSPLSRHLVVGLASRRVSIVPSDRWVMAIILQIRQKDVPGKAFMPLRELEQSRESRINCIRWLPTSGQGFIYATNTGQLVILS